MLEPELEALLLRIVPNLARDWSGASPEDLEELEERVELTGHDFPPFYRWFLSRLAGSVGALHPMLRGFTAASVLEAYRTGSVDIGPTQFLIGRMPDALMPLDVYYDLAHPLRDDAIVLSAILDAGPESQISETFREWIAARAMIKFGVMTAPHRCFGAFVDPGRTAAAQLETVMTALGFTSPITTGPFCRLYERGDMTMVAKSTVKPENLGILIYEIGGPSVAAIRRLLGEIGRGTTLQVDADRWATRSR
ncbi:hypothetical protein SAMN02745121_08877 [Nannocystis exedens]|uniref:Uncharacterized protein n=1 Tax=Nannocystis exedens TaxID=54 RepID=A0A1I2IR22_9BACT|nr:hypothetical protein [Nannocystis exedens]PCC73478.1 hypothetical protein NAEX_06566 [Nannocystis exedens]SFF44150.1 hypothetical protein SAMN02745121_08877 [Nannocystis exedens]